MAIAAEVNEITKHLQPLPEPEGPTEQERENAIAYYRHPKRVTAYLEAAGVRLRLRREAHQIDQAKIPPECHDWVEKCRQGASMILCGPPGGGKSTAAVWCLRRLWLEGKLEVPEANPSKPQWSAPRAFYRKTGELYDAVFEKDGLAIKLVEGIDVLVLDDWGADYEHAWPLSRLDRLVDRRWDDGLPTIVTTNLQPAEIEATLPRAYDRLTGWPGPGVVVVDRPSLRKLVEEEAS